MNKLKSNQSNRQATAMVASAKYCGSKLTDTKATEQPSLHIKVSNLSNQARCVYVPTRKALKFDKCKKKESCFGCCVAKIREALTNIKATRAVATREV